VWRLLAVQFSSPLVLLLAGAAVLSGWVGEAVDALAVGLIVLLNGFVGFYQEYSAQNAVLALRAMTAPRARVVRDGEAHLLPSAEVVRGDLLLLEAGDVVAADADLVEAHQLATNEAPLTGESLPVEKQVGGVADDAPLAERRDRVFSGTAVTQGAGRAVVRATGMATELGRIAHLLAEANDGETPLQRQLARVGRSLSLLCLAIVAGVAGVGLLRGQAPLEVALIAIPLAVAAVPEGLPAVVTVALSMGVQRMARHRVLVRRLPAVETLGAATVICTDKTGTLTSGVMTVREVWGPDADAVLAAAAACCDAELRSDGGVSGDPTEVALLRAARERGVERAALEAANPRTAVLAFDSVRKRMSVKRADGRWYVKGAVDLLLPRCAVVPDGADAAHADLARRGLRVLGVAVGTRDDESELTLLGLVGMADPPRPEAIDAVKAARDAGVTVVMITGDHPATAAAIGREMGIVRADEDPTDRVHARVTPEEKLRIVRAWKDRGAIVAMTGDGVNDAPALREAHIGIAMGVAGTEVTREAADMVLADDNFASIVHAIREGRGIWENIRKTVVYLLGGNLGELLLVLGASLLGLPVPLLPLHILWVNLVTDGLPALALGMDPAPADALSHPPRPTTEPLLRRLEWAQIAVFGALDAAVTLGVYAAALPRVGVAEARTLAFATLVFTELLRSFAARSPTRLFWEVGAFTNRTLLAVVAVTGATQLALHHLPWTRSLFDLAPLTPAQFGLALGLALVPVSTVELGKLVVRSRRSR
jgi:Ca2+-transporting ATPase